MPAKWVFSSNTSLDYIMPINGIIIPVFDVVFNFLLLFFCILSILFFIDQIKYWILGSTFLFVLDGYILTL
jgi:hypothetical protein